MFSNSYDGPPSPSSEPPAEFDGLGGPSYGLSECMQMKRRSGYMLIELMAVIAAGAAMLAIATGVIYTLFEAEEASRDQLRHALTSGRLADQFRRDVHAATEMTEAPPSADDPHSPGWVFTLSGERSIEYLSDGRSMIRVDRAEGKTVRRESFDLGRHWQASIGRRPEGETAVISLRMEADRRPSSEPFSRALVIEAVLSMDHRHAISKEP